VKKKTLQIDEFNFIHGVFSTMNFLESTDAPLRDEEEKKSPEAMSANEPFGVRTRSKESLVSYVLTTHSKKKYRSFKCAK